MTASTRKKAKLEYNGTSLELKCINTIRAVSADQPEAANSGHPGAPMGCAPMAHLLWGEVMKYSSKDPKWISRDRFVLSNGHACALQYTMLHLTGYDLSIEDLKQFRKLGSKTPGHPECFVTEGEFVYRRDRSLLINGSESSVAPSTIWILCPIPNLRCSLVSFVVMESQSSSSERFGKSIFTQRLTRMTFLRTYLCSPNHEPLANI